MEIGLTRVLGNKLLSSS